MSDTHAPRFLVPAPLSAGEEIGLPDRVARHIAVLRLREGDPLVLFSGEGGEHAARLTAVARGAARVLVGEYQHPTRESPLKITLAQCICGGDRMDLALQKATELGVHAIVPLQSERSVVKLRDDRTEKKLLHWRNVVVAACEQCGLNTLPSVATPVDLHAWLASLQPWHAGDATRIVLNPEATTGMGQLAQCIHVILLIGPEGGLAPHELAAAADKGFRGVRLGPRVLRTETAPLAAITALQVLWGDLR